MTWKVRLLEESLKKKGGGYGKAKLHQILEDQENYKKGRRATIKQTKKEKQQTGVHIKRDVNQNGKTK